MVLRKLITYWLIYGHLPTSLLTVLPVGMYSTTLVQYLYISGYLPDNKPVLSYLLLCLLPQWWPNQVVPFALYTVLLYTHTHTHTLAIISASRSFSRLCKWFLFQVLQCTLHWLHLSQHYLLTILFRNQQFFSKFIFLLEVSRELPQRLTLNTFFIALSFLVVRCTV